ncbi:hypothetical protein CLV84_1351 [Neolewinella xylanilytica]|uniref:Outer membrane protein beta-barrel domain-containing protein n=1 Tax=Neolewinella xylanilytica TaxID=1514080 RepID=A0A2S6IA57_9BACT|nr:hypothetical protein [Neolewinella xylanilytica]PPK88384.1 hypothetical protein CLV84_1351 [Neolewinella xylanilytica]
MHKAHLSFLLFLLLSGVLTAQSINYRAFEWDVVRLGYAIPGGERFDLAVAMGTEVRYNASDRTSIGLRNELLASISDPDRGASDIGTTLSVVAVGDYYLRTEGNFRPFAGLGFGGFVGTTTTYDDNGNRMDEGDLQLHSALGLVPRLGLELSHLRIAVEYNLLFGNQLSDYVGIMIAPTLFGGPK